jgi:1-acyl-sn-glycerol-3-phosphate acyltransferase
MFKLIISIILLLIRLPLLILLIAFGLLAINFYPKDVSKFKKSHYFVMMLWMKVLSILLGIRTIVTGNVDNSADLYVSNHVTYLDIIIINKLLPVNFIAKSEIADWPIIGNLASRTGTLYIKRGDNIESKKIINEMQKRLDSNKKIFFFPEGRIGNGRRIKKFHSKLFRAVENRQISIQPVVIRYPKNYPIDTSYSNDISVKSQKGEMIRLYLDVLMKPKSHVILHFLEKVNTRDYDFIKLTSLTEDKINKELDKLDS